MIGSVVHHILRKSFDQCQRFQACARMPEYLYVILLNMP